MKKKIIGLALLPLLLLGSCRGVDAEVELNESIEAVKGLTDYKKTTYTVNPTGHVLSFTKFGSATDPQNTKTYNLPTDPETSFGTSFLLKAPQVITKTNYYPENADDLSSGSYSYKKITNVILSSDYDIGFMQFEKDGDNLVFYSEGISKNLLISNVLTDEANNIYSTVTANSRYNLKLTYGSNGRLLKEECANIATLTNDYDKRIEASCEYTYTE
ncbi:MAG: hypothetical protein WCR56_02110 [Bacilli bacterium]